MPQHHLGMCAEQFPAEIVEVKNNKVFNKIEQVIGDLMRWWKGNRFATVSTKAAHIEPNPKKPH